MGIIDEYASLDATGLADLVRRREVKPIEPASPPGNLRWGRPLGHPPCRAALFPALPRRHRRVGNVLLEGGTIPTNGVVLERLRALKSSVS